MTTTGVVPPLATRATLAAWPPDSVSVPGATNASSSQPAAPLQAAEQALEMEAFLCIVKVVSRVVMLAR
ncbi:hypothetical protein CsSME_00007163 [Camellia sinensis var. sinensis]